MTSASALLSAFCPASTSSPAAEPCIQGVERRSSTETPVLIAVSTASCLVRSPRATTLISCSSVTWLPASARTQPSEGAPTVRGLAPAPC
eukprot:3121770-Rhodomonas_salina.4